MQKLTNYYAETAETEDIEKENNYGLEQFSRNSQQMFCSKYPAKILPTFILNLDTGSEYKKSGVSNRPISSASKLSLKKRSYKTSKNENNKSVLQCSNRCVTKTPERKNNKVNKAQLVKAASKHALFCKKFQIELSKLA